MELYPIGAVARRTGLTVTAIRFYADAGVIAPTGHTAAGHRLYDVDAIARLELVRTLRDLGAGLDEIRRLLSDETSLAELATTHLALIERQMRHLHARRAVLRAIVRQPTATERVILLSSLASMSDDERDRLLDDFWAEVTDGLAVHAAFVAHLHALRPHLPADPTTEQVQAWIALADLVRDRDFRLAVRGFFHDAFASPRAAELTAPERLERLERHRRLEVEAWEAQRSGLSPDTPEARAIAEALVASIADLAADGPLTGPQRADLRRSMAEPDPADAAHRHADRAVSGFTELLSTYLRLMATINETPDPEPYDAEASERWVAAALSDPPRTRHTTLS